MVPHEQLLHKLSGLGVQGKVQAWIRGFLSRCMQDVIVDSERLEWRYVVSGIRYYREVYWDPCHLYVLLMTYQML